MPSEKASVPASIIVRLATVEDVELLHRFAVDLSTYEDEPDAVTSTPQTLARDGFGRDPKFAALIAERGGKPVGFALYTFNWEVVKQTGFTRDPAAIDRRLHELNGVGGTSLFDAILLACAGLERLGLGARIRERLDRGALVGMLADRVFGEEATLPVTFLGATAFMASHFRFAGAIDNVGGDMLGWLTRVVDFWGNIASIGQTHGR